MNISYVKVTIANPGPLRTKMRAAAMPGEDPITLRTPEELAPKIVALCEPGWTQTGKLYDFPRDRLLSFQAPAQTISIAQEPDAVSAQDHKFPVVLTLALSVSALYALAAVVFRVDDFADGAWFSFARRRIIRSNGCGRNFRRVFPPTCSTSCRRRR